MLTHPFRTLALSVLVAATGAASLAATSVPLPGPAVRTVPVAAAVPLASPPAPAADAPSLRAASAVRPAVVAATPDAVAGLACRDSELGVPLCHHHHPAADREQRTTVSQDSSAARLGCYGDGSSGPRVRAVYARPEGSPDRLSAVHPDLHRWATAASGAVDASAQRSGGRRHVRFATTAGTTCQLAVASVALPGDAFRSFPATIEALQARGYRAPWSKYLVWTESSVLCGMATTYSDDRPAPHNANDSATPSYARVDRPCWGRAEAHELMHMLGAVQRTAPNSTDGFHCNDGRDVMCYADGTARSTQRTVCAGDVAVLDCRNDDYFHAAPPAGSYLATRWNTARSSFLSVGLTDPPPAPGPSSGPQSAPPTPRPSASPTTPLVPALVLPQPSLPPVLPAPSVTPLLPLGGVR